MRKMPSSSPTTTSTSAASNSSKSSGTGHDDHEKIHTHSATVQLKQAFAGATAGCMTRTLTQPFDVLKIRFQLQVEPVGFGDMRLFKGSHYHPPEAEVLQVRSTSKYTSMLQACRIIYREEGLRAFWKGHNAGQFMSITYGVMQFWTYEQIHVLVSQWPWLSIHPKASNFLAGGLAGCIATVFSMPFDVIRTRVVAQDPGSGYYSIVNGFNCIIQTEGPRGLFRGLATTLIQIGPLVGANFMFYNYFNDFAAKILEPPGGHLPTWCLLLNGGAAGTASKAAVYPLDFIKKRLQVQGFEESRKSFGRTQRCENIMQCIRLTAKEEGMLGFYKGMVPTLWKSGMTTAFYFGIYDKIKELLQL